MTKIVHRHRWSDWHRTEEQNKDGQYLYLRLCLTGWHTERLWAWPERGTDGE